MAFVTIILWDDGFEENAKGNYVKHRMALNDVNVSQIENGFEHSRIYADKCEMDDSQSNMEASDIKALFFKEDVATYTGRLIAASATKSPFEVKFFGNVRLWDTDNERMKTEEVNYLFSRREMTTKKPVTIWKDNAVLTGLGMTYNVDSKEITINRQVVIRLWDKEEEKKPKPLSDIDPMSGLPIAAPIETILENMVSPTSVSSNTTKLDTNKTSTPGKNK